MGDVKAVIIMGVSGSGKTTVGRLAAERLGWEYFDADDFHPTENVEKMRRGIPLTDTDRTGWLSSLAALLSDRLAQGRGTILACSALKEKYRRILQGGNPEVRFAFLKGGYARIAERIHARRGHYMNPALLESQFEALEEPEDALVLDIGLSPLVLAEQVYSMVRTDPASLPHP